ncbi:restriction system protein [Pseudarthrobacter defluvii]|uniref:restriction endonuclease n=1 Tax=Pseudarthrobacter defluvii TaxID=410837 RepID=UPI0027843FCA|nr:restriction endonuclease [Pseudarthrobacter defluvii]MDQ0771492.1 restriction system protein [Pseudarthrobacter defluvii]
MSEPAPESFVTEVPIWPALIVPVLQALEDGRTLHRKDLFHQAADKAGLSESARLETLNSGGLRYEQRMGWVLSHVIRANWMDRPTKGHYCITDEGRRWLKENPGGINYSQARELFAKHWPKSEKPTDPTQPAAPDQVAAEELEPVEQIEDGINRIHAEVGVSLLARLREGHPDFFEEAVVKLLLKMGYGGAEQRGRRIGGTGDGGVDGVIDQDALGLDRIYVQAKRYADGNTVGRETIQAFVGALHGVGASRGVFITTSAFTSGARQYAENVPSRIILIDAARLVGLMIKYRVGVQVKQTYDVVELDEDFFE